jgi:hypothetical protein
MSRAFLAQEAALGARELIEYCYAQGWTDGLPVVPPIKEFVDEFLAQTSRDPDDVLMVQSHLDRVCTVRQAAVNAIMAGCKPEYFPTVLAVIRDQLGFNSLGNIFGPGDRPNATVGRALRLIVMNVLGIRPHEFDQSTQGTSAKYACCLAENEEDSPWEPLHVERGFAASDSTVTVQMIRSDVFVEHRSTQVPEEILSTIADSMSYGGMITQVTEARMLHGAVVVMGPEHAQLIAARGWSKQDCKQFLFEHLGKYKHELRRMGKLHADFEAEAEDAFIRMTSSPDWIMLVVAGANNGGVSTVCPSITTGREIGKNATQLIPARS